MTTSLPTDSEERKRWPLFNGLFGYFGAALANVAHHSWKSNEKHNPGQTLRWSMDKSADHADCCARHLLDLGDALAKFERAVEIDEGSAALDAAITEATAHAWRSLALLQTLLMKYRDVPMPFNARREPRPDKMAALDATPAGDVRHGHVVVVSKHEGTKHE